MSTEMSKSKFRKVLSKEKLEGRLNARKITLRRMVERNNAQLATIKISGIATGEEARLIELYTDMKYILAELCEVESDHARIATKLRDELEAYSARRE